MPQVSAGILLYRRSPRGIEVLLVHPGGPFFVRKDKGAWSIPKGEVRLDEDLEAGARREFSEEVGSVPSGALVPIGSVRQKSGKVVHAWALEGDFDLAGFRSNIATLEWPPRSGRTQEFPEVDRAEFFGIPEARERINAAQAEFLDRLLATVTNGG